MVDLTILDSCTFKPLFGVEQDALSNVMEVNLTFVMEEGGKGQSFTT